MEYLCDENNAAAPRVGCGCLRCYRARERFLDPELIQMCFADRITPTRTILHRCLTAYLGERVEWAALYPEIIKTLIEYSDEAFERETRTAQLQPLPMVFKET